jgi:hypothetical protein
MGKSLVKSSKTYLKVRVGEEESARKIQLQFELGAAQSDAANIIDELVQRLR